MSTDLKPVLQALKASLALAFPAPVKVTRSLVDPSNENDAQLLAGIVCLVTEGGGDFGNYLGRIGELGDTAIALVVFHRVAEGAAPESVEDAELDWLKQLTAWCQTGNHAPALGLEPGDFVLSKQLEAPYGWLLLKLAVTV